ncbi:rab-GTPase-TBC domain-containing protein [Lipomyces japonicus]|uniref:rab-GTPase-TBC domain-containing protein n=1 Tax=Lipomyces japonicus TaxID=56871 RepID=UPI0034CE0C42
MASIDIKRRKWNKLVHGSFSSLSVLKASVVNGGSTCDDTLRSLFLLLVPDLQPDTWVQILHEERQNYENLKKNYLGLHLRRANDNNDNSSGVENDQEDINVVNPLSEDNSNPWNTFWNDEELRKNILQDIERTFPDIEYFRNEKIQRTLLDILFVYSKTIPDVSYQQGMHELLAPIYYVVAHDAVDIQSGSEFGGNKLMQDVLSSDFVEHDSYILFQLIMGNAWEWFAAVGKAKGPTENGRVTPPIVIKARRIQENYLRKIDPELEKHLRILGIEPQIWAIRWIRLLFGREFSFSQLLLVWDCLFAADNTLELVDFVCIAMLLRIRDQLLLADYTGCLTLLLRYPVSDAMTPSSFIEDAVFLHVHTNHDGGRRIISQYVDLDEAYEAQQPLHMVNGVLLPSTKNLYLKRAMMEKTVSDIAQNVMTKSERWAGDANKYVKERVEDVRRTASAYQSAFVQQQGWSNTKDYYYSWDSSNNKPPAQAIAKYNERSSGKTTPRFPSNAVSDPAIDDTEFIRERNESLSKVLSTAIEALAPLRDSEENSQYKLALDRIAFVRKALLFDNVKIEQNYLDKISILSNDSKSLVTHNLTSSSSYLNKQLDNSQTGLESKSQNKSKTLPANPLFDLSSDYSDKLTELLLNDDYANRGFFSPPTSVQSEIKNPNPGSIFSSSVTSSSTLSASPSYFGSSTSRAQALSTSISVEEAKMLLGI